RSFIEDLLF
nr:Chain C, peptide from Spike glycoprotein [Severe acute respiratory syndrome coronavirus 2]